MKHNRHALIFLLHKISSCASVESWACSPDRASRYSQCVCSSSVRSLFAPLSWACSADRAPRYSRAVCSSSARSAMLLCSGLVLLFWSHPALAQPSAVQSCSVQSCSVQSVMGCSLVVPPVIVKPSAVLQDGPSSRLCPGMFSGRASRYSQSVCSSSARSLLLAPRSWAVLWSCFPL